MMIVLRFSNSPRSSSKACSSVGQTKVKSLGILDAEHVYNEEQDSYLVEGSNVTYRATFLIDESGKIFHESVNDMPLGRNVKEYLRLIDAYTHVQKFGEVCPANLGRRQRGYACR